MATAHLGDVLVRTFEGHGLEVVDAATHQQIAIVPSIEDAIRIAGDRGGAVWRDNVDNRGRPLGEPILLMPQMTHSATGLI